MKRSKPNNIERLDEFMRFCDELEKHVFFAAYQGGGRLEMTASFPADGDARATVNFDEMHLESFLMRLRQVFFENELFYLKDLRRAVIKTFQESADFERFYSELWQVTQKPWPKRHYRTYKANGADVVEGFNFLQLIEAWLYTGRVHSEWRLDPAAPAHICGVSEAHVVVEKQLSTYIASASLKAAENIFAFRMHVLKLARETKRVHASPRLVAFDRRCRAAGY